MPIAVDALKKIGGLDFGKPQYSERLTVVPMEGDLSGPTYTSLSQAFENSHIEVTEVKSGETVPELEATNSSPAHVLILDGEELVGAMQNRVLNTSVLLPPRSTTRIPVSCTEAGRWQRRSMDFADSDEIAPLMMRSGMKRRVFESLKLNGTRDAGQGAVWEDVSRMEADFQAPSRTSAMKDTTRRYRKSLDKTIGAFQVLGRQVGACIFIDGRMAGMEVVSSPMAFQSLWPRLIRSYTLDSRRLKTRPTKQDGSPIDRARKMLSEVLVANWREFDAVGTGKDLRLEYPGATGSALIYEGDIVHLSVMSSRIQV